MGFSRKDQDPGEIKDPRRQLCGRPRDLRVWSGGGSWRALREIDYQGKEELICFRSP